MQIYRQAAISGLELAVLCYDLLKRSEDSSSALMNSGGVEGGCVMCVHLEHEN